MLIGPSPWQNRSKSGCMFHVLTLLRDLLRRLERDESWLPPYAASRKATEPICAYDRLYGTSYLFGCGLFPRNLETRGWGASLFGGMTTACRYCGLTFKDGDIWEIDHIVPKSLGGTNTYGNCQVLHRHCHDQRHAKWAQTGITLN